MEFLIDDAHFLVAERAATAADVAYVFYTHVIADSAVPELNPRPMLFISEIQLEQAARRLGLGRALMRAAEATLTFGSPAARHLLSSRRHPCCVMPSQEIAKQSQMAGVLLKCQNANPDAKCFYEARST